MNLPTVHKGKKNKTATYRYYYAENDAVKHNGEPCIRYVTVYMNSAGVMTARWTRKYLSQCGPGQVKRWGEEIPKGCGTAVTVKRIAMDYLRASRCA